MESEAFRQLFGNPHHPEGPVQVEAVQMGDMAIRWVRNNRRLEPDALSHPQE